MNLEFHLRLAGALQIALAAAHLPFPQWFNWRAELARLSLLNRQIFIVHTLFIVLILILFGALSLSAPAALLEPAQLAPFVCAGLAVFWLARLCAQLLVYDRRLWIGHRGRTAIHFAVTLLWIYLAATYGAALVKHLALS